MPNIDPNDARAKAWQLLCQYTKSESLRKHALAVEAAMRQMAAKFAEDVEYWGLIGLLHDFDYEQFPDTHPKAGESILIERGYDRQFINSILSHVDTAGVPRLSKLEQALFAVDELCGFVIAVALVRPSKKLADVTVKSVTKKMKDRAFARQVSREDILRGSEALGLPLDEVIDYVIEALKRVAPELGL